MPVILVSYSEKIFHGFGGFVTTRFNIYCHNSHVIVARHMINHSEKIGLRGQSGRKNNRVCRTVGEPEPQVFCFRPGG